MDHATGLMWQKSGQERYIQYGARAYCENLTLAGYDNWRLPTIPELMSLLKPEKQSNGLYIDPIFDESGEYPDYWSADIQSSGSAWFVHFSGGYVGWDTMDDGYYVRCVRPRQFVYQDPSPPPIETITLPDDQEKKTEQDELIQPPSSSLRSEPKTVSFNSALREFELVANPERLDTGVWIPETFIENQFEDREEVIIDHATGLTWQKSRSESYMTYADAQKYAEELNKEKFGGYDDWRVPTIPELMSLLEPEKQENKLYINPIFDTPKGWYWVWSADRLPEGEGGSSGGVWLVDFSGDGVIGRHVSDRGDVRCVRP